MAKLKRLDLEGNISAEVDLTEEEFAMLGRTKKVLVVSTEDEFFVTRMTTGKIGNGNRIMVPNRLLERNHIEKLRKKVPARIFEVNKEKYPLIKLEESSLIPEFED